MLKGKPLEGALFASLLIAILTRADNGFGFTEILCQRFSNKKVQADIFHDARSPEMHSLAEGTLSTIDFQSPKNIRPENTKK